MCPMTQARTTPSDTGPYWPSRLLALLPALLLAGCVNDSASYIVSDKDHTITLVRHQDWFWQAPSLDVVPTRLPECRGGITVQDVPRDTQMALYRAPDSYAEPIFLLRIDTRHFAVSTESCRVQPFAETPAELGTPLGSFEEKDGRLAFTEQPTAAP